MEEYEYRTPRRSVHHHRKPWVHTQPEQANKYIYVVEILGLNGRWRPYACPPGPSFSLKDARKLIQTLRKSNRLMRRAWEEGRFRIIAYEQAILRLAGTHREE